MDDNKKEHLTPLMKQYYEIKQKYSDAILMFQVGDFYELFFEDAIIASSFLSITLTKKGFDNLRNPIPLAGVPISSADHYISKLVKGGFKVAICDQIEQSNKSSKLILREVKQVLTPGTLTDLKLLDAKSPSYLSFIFSDKSSNKILLFFIEIMAGQLFITILDDDKISIELELNRFMPDEVILINFKEDDIYFNYLKKLGYKVYLQNLINFKDDIVNGLNWILSKSLSSDIKNIINNNIFNIELAVSCIYYYLNKNNFQSLSYIKNIVLYNNTDFLIIDNKSFNNLEIIDKNVDKPTLFTILDHAVSSMGSRFIKKIILKPLVKANLINERLDSLEYFISNLDILNNIREKLKNIPDLERITGRIGLDKANINDYRSLSHALSIISSIKQLDIKNSTKLIRFIFKNLYDLKELQSYLENSLNYDYSLDYIIKDGFNVQLDNYRQLIINSAIAISKLEAKEQQLSGIQSLKIKYNGISGYSIEITKSNLDNIPERYKRIQTLSNKERFVTDELKQLEYDINNAKFLALSLEKELFNNLKCYVNNFINELRKSAYAISYLDALSTLAYVSHINNYSKPIIVDSNKRYLYLEKSRHPIVEKISDKPFIDNDIQLSDDVSTWVITGPNMAGKSTFLKQVALTIIMAQIGCFVPAKSAKLSIFDRIFTRIGASDNLALGKSTFLVEMEEVSLICNYATSKSLLILDEVGRGTSTFDGIALAKSIIEYIASKINAFCLFATHYHEITNITKDYSSIKAYYVSTLKKDDDVIILHKIIPGVSDGSFAIEVAKIAGLPDSIISNAQNIVNELKKNNRSLENIFKIDDSYEYKKKYLDLINVFDRYKLIIDMIKNLDLENISLKDSINILWDLNQKVKNI